MLMWYTSAYLPWVAPDFDVCAAAASFSGPLQVGGLAATFKTSFKVVNRPLFEEAAAALAARNPTNSPADAGVLVSARALRKVHPPRSSEATGRPRPSSTRAPPPL